MISKIQAGGHDSLYKVIFAVYGSYDEAKRTVNFLKRVLRVFESNKKRFSKEGIQAAGDLLVNIEEVRRFRETTVSNTLKQLENLMNFNVAVYSAQTAKDAKRDASSMTSCAFPSSYCHAMP